FDLVDLLLGAAGRFALRSERGHGTRAVLGARRRTRTPPRIDLDLPADEGKDQRAACRGWERRTPAPGSGAGMPIENSTGSGGQIARWRPRVGGQGPAVGLAGSVAVELLAQLAPLLRLGRQRGGGPREQPGNADRLAGFLAIAVLAAFDAGERLLHLLQQLALAVARAQLQRMLLLDRRAVGGIGDDDGFTQVFRGLVRVCEDVPLDLLQPLAKEGQL